MSRITVEHALEELSKDKAPFKELFVHGTLAVEIYKPKRSDRQTPHERDEVYVVISGSGFFINDGKREAFGEGDVLFVPAGVEHRFVKFTKDFATWVFFYGPEGGESPRHGDALTG